MLVRRPVLQLAALVKERGSSQVWVFLLVRPLPLLWEYLLPQPDWAFQMQLIDTRQRQLDSLRY